MSGQFCIKRDDFNTNATKSVSRMRNDEENCDVSLVANDGKHVLGHKSVLNCNSEYIRDSISTRKSPFPIISFSFLDSKGLNRMLDFMYHGQVIVNLEDMENFIHLSKKLRIRGMTDDKYSVTLQESVDEVNKSQSKEKTIGEKYFNDVCKDEVGKTKTMNIKQVHTPRARYGKPPPIIRYKNVPLTKNDFNLEAMRWAKHIGSGRYRCKHCAREAASSSNIKEHVETHLVGLIIQCPLCRYCFERSEKYRKHFIKGKCSKSNQYTYMFENVQITTS